MDRHHLEPHRGLRLPAGQPHRPTRAVQRRHLRPPDRRAAAGRRHPAGQLGVELRHRHLPDGPGRGGHPGGHPGPSPRLQPPAGSGLGHGLLDRRAGGRQPHHERRGRPHARPLHVGQRLEEPIRHLRRVGGGRLRPLPDLDEGPLEQAPRPAYGVARDRALLEARARGLSTADLERATANPWRQILKWDLVLAALGIALFLLVYYAAASFFTIYWSTTFKNSNGTLLSVTQANGLNEWFWGAEIITLILVGLLSDKLLVRKPLMMIGAVGSIVFLIIFLGFATHPNTGWDTLVFFSVCLAVFISATFAPWMAAYTESVEAKNPALVATGLALWGWILRLVVGLSFIFLPLVVTSVNPIIDNQPYATPEIQSFIANHQASVTFAQDHAALLKVVNENQAVVNAVAANPSAANIAAAVKALGPANFAQLVKYQSQFTTLVVPYASQLNYLSAHQSQLQSLQKALNEAPKQWQHWYWVCVGGMVLFLPTIFLARGRWSPKAARRDEAAHDEAVTRELAQLTAEAGARAPA